MIKTHIVITKETTLKRGLADNPKWKIKWSTQFIRNVAENEEKGDKKQMGQVENKSENVKNSLNFSFDSKEVKDYLKGFTLETINKKGYVLICVEGVSLGWCKDDGRLLKNLYPKGLRIQE